MKKQSIDWKSINWTSILPHIGIILLLVLLTFMFLSPVREGKVLVSHDAESWKYMAQETLEYNKTHDEDKTLWTNSMFGGMPTYMITMDNGNNILIAIQNLFQRSMESSAFMILLYLVCFYFFFLIIGCNKWIAVFGSVFMTFASYNIIIIAAGHYAKAVVIAYMAPLIGSIWIAFRKDPLKGAVLTLPFVALAIRNNHLQILYYTLFILVVLGVVEFIYAVKNKKIKDFFKTIGYLLASAIIAVGMNATLLLTTYEYSKYTMRGDSNGLTPMESSEKPGGLDKDYITAWSYGIDETLTLLIPDFKGGASGGALSANSATGNKLKEMGIPNVERVMEDFHLPLYWGTQPFTSGPVYIGAIVCFLFVLGLFLVDARTKWWLVPVILLTLLLSWGRNFMPLTDFFIDYIPLYNKFRTVSMTLVATGFCISMLAVLGLCRFLKKDADPDKNRKALYISAGITGGICLLFWLIPSLAGDFIGSSDSQFTGNYEFLKATLPLDREALLRSDALRSLTFIVLAAASLWVYNQYKSKIKVEFIYAALIILVAADLIPVAGRYLNDDNFEEKKRGKDVLLPSDADKMILRDKSYYRVLDATVNIFNDSKPSYFHKNVGGYHAAKLSRYQELITYQLGSEINSLFQQFNTARTESERQDIFKDLGVLNMLNTKYVIYNHQAPPLINPYANGNVWFVSSYKIAENADREMDLLGEIDTKRELVADKKFESLLTDISDRDTMATIRLVSYAPNKLRYSYSSESEQIAVFSEIYYDKGWDAYINGEKVPYFRADYLLRAMVLKAGTYEIEFKFDPAIYQTGKILSITFSIMFVLLVAGYIVYEFRLKRRN
jgi:hypothetical protein